MLNDAWPQKGNLVSCNTMTLLFSMFANHQTGHQATRKVDCQPGDCRWPVNITQEFVYRLTYSFYYPQTKDMVREKRG